MPKVETVRRVGRYALYGEIASGGMATVHFGRLVGGAGFSRTVAVKRLHPHLAKEKNFVAMFVDEARLAARIRHPNTVATLDVVELEDELFLVMEYIEGESLARLIKAARDVATPIPLSIAAAVICGALAGLHAAHEATDEFGKPLGIVHRDVSPQNVIVGRDGIARVLDFGVAKAAGRMQRDTHTGDVKGKLEYLAREQLKGEATRATDVFAASLVLWEMLTLRRHYSGAHEAEILLKVVSGEIEPPSKYAQVPPDLEAVVLRGLDPDPMKRFATAHEMAMAIEACAPIASSSAVSTWVEALAHDALVKRALAVTSIERTFRSPADEPSDPAVDADTSKMARNSEPPSSFGGSGTGAPLAASTGGSELSTDVSAIKNRGTSAPGAPSATRRAALVGGVIAALAALVIVVRLSRQRDVVEIEAPSVAAGATLSPAPSLPVEAHPPTPIATQAAPSAVPWERLPETSIDVSKLPDATMKPAAAASPQPACNPPFVVVDGIRKYKRECLKRGGHDSSE